MKQVIVIRQDLKLSKGKMSAHAAHASLSAFLEAFKKAPDKTEEWLTQGSKKIVLKIADEKSLKALYNKIPNKIPKALITDAGLTHLKAGTVTCFAAGPWEDKEINKYTGKLKLVN